MLNTVTINTALDKLLFIDTFNRNCTNRIVKTVEVIGGKGTHVSMNLNQLGVDHRCFGVVRGKTGRQIMDILNAAEHIELAMLHGEEGNSRTNYAVIEAGGGCTLITETGHMVTKEECDAVVDMIAGSVQNGDYLLLSGDASNTERPSIYNTIMQRVSGQNIRVFLDTSSENLVEGLKAKPFLVKPNMEELAEITGHPLQEEAAVLHAMQEICAMGVEVVAVSCGEDGSYVMANGAAYKIPPLQVAVKNTIGCGDAYFSGLAYGFEKNMGLEDTLRMATSVAAATAESELTVGFDLARAQQLYKQVQVQRL